VSEKAGQAASSLALVSSYCLDDWLWVGSAGRIVALEMGRLLDDQQSSPILSGWRVDRNQRLPNHLASNVRNLTLTPQRESQATPIDIPVGSRATQVEPTSTHKQRMQPFTVKFEVEGLAARPQRPDLSDPDTKGHSSEGLVIKMVPVGAVVWSASRRDSWLCAWSKSDLGVCLQAIDIATIVPKVRGGLSLAQ